MYPYAYQTLGRFIAAFQAAERIAGYAQKNYTFVVYSQEGAVREDRLDMATLGEVLSLGVHQHQAGNLPQAEQLYQQILERDPRHADALHLLGVIAHQRG